MTFLRLMLNAVFNETEITPPFCRSETRKASCLPSRQSVSIERDVSDQLILLCLHSSIGYNVYLYQQVDDNDACGDLTVIPCCDDQAQAACRLWTRLILRFLGRRPSFDVLTSWYWTRALKVSSDV